MQTNTLQPKTKRRHSRQIARGGKRGKTAGRGTKGQKARAGHRIYPEIRDLIRKYPKLRGHGKNRARGVNSEKAIAVTVNLSQINIAFKDGDKVNPKTLIQVGLVSNRSGLTPMVKILATGEIDKKVFISKCFTSDAAKEKVLKAGGEVKSII